MALSFVKFTDVIIVSMFNVKDVPTSIPKSDLLHVNTAVIHVAGQLFLAV